MRYTMCFFPLIGVLIGAAVAGFVFLSEKLGAGEIFTALVGTALPLVITGGIHMDGFLDTTDARRSFLPRERKLEILKDAVQEHLPLLAAKFILCSMGLCFQSLISEAVCCLQGHLRLNGR